MRARNAGIAVVAGLALAGGLAVGGEATGGDATRGDDGSGSTTSSPSGGPPLRPEPAGADVRVGPPIEGYGAREQRRSRDAGARRMFRIKTTATAGTVRVTHRVRAGGERLDWAVRAYERPRVTGGLASRVRADPTRPGIRCVQLGRLRGRTFGWLVPGGRFRPSAATTDLLTTCENDAGAFFTRPGGGAVVVPDRDPRDPDARPRETVVWGLAPAGARRVEVRWAGWRRTVAVHDGTYLVVGPPPTGPFVEQRPVVRVPGRPVRPAPTRPEGAPRQWSPQVAERPRIAARLVDPATGRPVVVVVGEARGRPCDGGTQPLSAGVVGSADDDTRAVSPIFRDCRAVPIPKRGSAPMITGYGGGVGPEPDRGIADDLRLVPGRFELTILTPPDVVRVELRTPVDVRTVRPVAPGIVHALYDGSVVEEGGLSGAPPVEVTGVRADGSTVRAAGAPTRATVPLGTAELEDR